MVPVEQAQPPGCQCLPRSASDGYATGMEKLRDTLSRFEPIDWSVENLITGEVITRFYCRLPAPHEGPAEELHPCSFTGRPLYLCSCCELHTRLCPRRTAPPRF